MTLALAMSVVGEVGAATGRSSGAFPESVLNQSVRAYGFASSGLRTAAPEALDQGFHAATALVLATVLAIAAAILTLIFKRWSSRRGLAHRVRLVALPTESFEPEAEEVLRLASQLVRTRRAVHRLGGRRSDAVRLRLVAMQGGRVVQFIEGPKQAEAVLRLGGYAEVELLPPETLEKAALVSMGPTGGDVTNDADEGGDEADEMVGGA